MGTARLTTQIGKIYYPLPCFVGGYYREISATLQLRKYPAEEVLVRILRVASFWSPGGPTASFLSQISLYLTARLSLKRSVFRVVIVGVFDEFCVMVYVVSCYVVRAYAGGGWSAKLCGTQCVGHLNGWNAPM